MTGFAPSCLIVEDSPMDQRIMARVLTQFGARVKYDFVSSLSEARAKLVQPDYSVIFLDNSLPDGRGVDFIKELAAHPRWNRLPAVLVTDWPSPFMFAKATSPNVVAVWTKDQFNCAAVRRLLFPSVRQAVP